ncbi:FkbM family methyltransferase [Candidatus Raskinella chloraquaticus]
MPMSYAQRLEDTHLDLIFADQATGFYIDVGGGHPVADNVSLHFYAKGWRGLVIEPQARLAAIHRALRPRDIVIEGLVGREQGEALFHQVARFHGFSTTISTHAAAAAELGANVEASHKPVTTLAKLCEDHDITMIDFLKVDVEGAEADVLAGADLARFRPRVIIVEAVAPGTMAPSHESFEPIILPHNYVLAFEDGLNRFYVRAEERGLAARFPAQPLAWDSVDHLYDHGRAAENKGHVDHALALALSRGFLASLPELSLDEVRAVAAEGAGSSANPASSLDDDSLRLALGRICAAYDGGHLMDD